MVVEQGLLGDGLAGQEGLHLVRGDIDDQRVTGEEILEFAVGGEVVQEGVRAEAAGEGGELVAGDRLGEGDRADRFAFHP